MKTMQAMLSRLRAKKTQPDKGPTSKPSLATVSDKPATKSSLSDILARHRETKADFEIATKGFNPEGEKVYSIQLRKSADIKELIKKARFQFPRLQIRQLNPFHLEIAGKAESRWFISQFNEFVKP